MSERMRDLHVARVRDDAVILDLRSGAYEMAPGVFAGCAADALDAAVADALDGRSFSTLSPFSDDPTGVERPRLRALGETGAAVRARDVFDLVVTWAALCVSYPGRSVGALVRPRRRRRGSQAERERRAAVFVKLLPWIPFPGRCLYRAYFLRLFLRRGGCDADWVFGVRSWPFRAHCWLEAQGVVLNDDPDYVRPFTPILRA